MLPALIGAGTSLLGGFLNREASDVAQGRAQDHANNQQELAWRVAQHGTLMKARDVMNAYGETGLHPLALMGMQSPSYSPVSYSGSANTSMGDAISNAGQGISRAMSATQTNRERLEHLSRLDDLTKERGALENDLLRVRIASETQRMAQERNPAFPGSPTMVPGQGNTPLVKMDPMKVTPTMPGSPGNEPGSNPSQGFLNMPDGGYMPVRGKNATEQLEDDWIGNAWWSIPHRFVPSLMGRAGYMPPSHVQLAPGMRWTFDASRGAYYQVPIGRRDGWDPSIPYRSHERGPR